MWKYAAGVCVTPIDSAARPDASVLLFRYRIYVMIWEKRGFNFSAAQQADSSSA